MFPIEVKIGIKLLNSSYFHKRYYFLFILEGEKRFLLIDQKLIKKKKKKKIGHTIKNECLSEPLREICMLLETITGIFFWKGKKFLLVVTHRNILQTKIQDNTSFSVLL